MLFQLLVIVNNVQTMAESLFKQHGKTSRLIILWFQKYLLNETMQGSKPITSLLGCPIGVAMVSSIPSTHKGHGFRYGQAGNKCFLRAGAATCIEFKVSSSHPTIV